MFFINKYFTSIKDIINIIDIGFNFVPCQHLDSASLFYNLIKNFDTELRKFNTILFFNKQKEKLKKLPIKNAEESPENFSIPTEFETCTDFSCLFKKLKRKSPKNIPFLKESLEFRFQFIYELSKQKIKHEINLNKSQFSALKYFIRHRPFRVLEADKNIGAVIMSDTTENELALNTLNDVNTYSRLNVDPLILTQNLIINELDSLVSQGHMSPKCRNLLIVNIPKLAKFRILPKLHKEVFGIRPIINCINSPTSLICLFVFLILQPFVVLTESYLQDSQHLLQILNDLKTINFDLLHLYSCDFESLYTNIELDLAVNLTLDFLKDKNALDLEHISLEGFKVLLFLIFKNNVFKYKSSFFKQNRGLAMGAICGPVLANVVVYKLEVKWLYIHRPLVYRRFIDDIIIISKTLLDLNVFKSNFGSLKLNVKQGLEVDFLDLKIYFDTVFNKIITSLYIKPTNTFSYLSIDSNHKSSIFKNIPVSLFIRIRRICSENHTFFYFSRFLINQLIQRGYSYDYLFSVVRNIYKIKRVNLLPYKNNKKTNNIDTLNKYFFVTPFNKSNISMNSLIKNSFIAVKNIFSLKDINISVVNSVNNSLRKIFLHDGNLSLTNITFKCSPCLLDKCKSCNFFINQNKISFNDTFSLPILSNSNCKSKFCIYIIYCNLCNCYYIGETMQTLDERFRKHLSDIKCFKPFINEKSEVAIHFNRKGHNYIKNLNVYIFASDIFTTERRKKIESELIHIFLISGCKVINARLIRHIDEFFTSIN